MNSVLPNPSSKGKDGQKPKSFDSHPGVDQFAHFIVNRLEDGELDRLGFGAMGVTYRALDTQLDRLVALKTINPQWVDDPEVRSRFAREAKAAARLQHPNIASVLYQGEEASVCFYVMELVAGENLHHYIRRIGPLSPVQALRMAHQIALALIAAEKKGIVHRDLKPSNVMVTTYSGVDEPHLKVIDFGLAKLAFESSASFATGGFIGTPEFASPEQCEERPLDVRSDIYSLGGILWFLLTASSPFSGTLISVIRAQINSQPEWGKLAGAAAPLLTILGRLMAKNRDFRPASAADAAREIDQTVQILSQDRRNFYPLGKNPDDDEAAPAPPAEASRRNFPGAEALRNPDSSNAWIVPAAVSICCFATGLYAWNFVQKRDAEERENNPRQIHVATQEGAPSPAAIAPKDSASSSSGLAVPPVETVPVKPVLTVSVSPPKLIRTDFTNSLGMKFVRPQGAPILASIWETRVRDFEAFAAQSSTLTSIAQDPNQRSWRNPGFKQGPDHPVVFVSAPDAMAFCRWLTDKEHRLGILSATDHYRIPSRLEWDQLLTGQPIGAPPFFFGQPPSSFAPFGGANTATGPFLWGGFVWPAPPNIANLGSGAYGGNRTAAAGDGFANTAPVGTFEPNIYGLYDMIGNAAEICTDGPDLNAIYIAQGASWESSTQDELRIGHPVSIQGSQRDAAIGFRCIIDRAR